MQTAIAAIFVFCLVVVVHEFGHFMMAKLSDVKVNEFSVGMGPRIFGKKYGETEYSVRAIPIGGYVRMEGEDEDSDDERSFNNKSIKARMGIILAGAIMNFILAFLVFAIYFMVMGSPTNTIDSVQVGLPASQAGLEKGDSIVEVEGIEIETWRDISRVIEGHGDSQIEVVVERDGNRITKEMVPELSENNRLLIGITPSLERSILESLRQSGIMLVTTIGMMFEFLSRLLTGGVSSEEVSGPVGIVYIIGEAAKLGFINVLYFTGFISVNLGFFNLLPIPALDGSRAMFLLLEAVRGKPIDPEKEGTIHIIGFLLLISLSIFITYKDIVKFNLF